MLKIDMWLKISDQLKDYKGDYDWTGEESVNCILKMLKLLSGEKSSCHIQAELPQGWDKGAAGNSGVAAAAAGGLWVCGSGQSLGEIIITRMS